METAPLKSFATWARRELITQVSARLTAVPAPASPERVENQDAVTMLERDITAAGGGAKGKNAIADKVAYTWFNRIIALRFMDANGYTRVGVVSPAHGQHSGQPEILADAKRGIIDPTVVSNKRTLDKIIGLLDGTRPSTDAQGEAYTLLLAEYCLYWNRSMPFMFEREGDYTKLLIPSNLLAADSILTRVNTALTEEVCRDVEVIGWLYQFYISERKDEVFAGFKKGKRAGAAEIPAATQLFTPHWIVRYLVENSVGRLWMLNHPSSRLVEQMDYYIPPVDEETDFLKISTPEELKIIDPACGSGHMLTYAFDLLYAIYEEEGYTPSEIPGLILTHNLYGTEIDPRAGALAAFALTMKARAKQRTFLAKHAKPKICVLEPISFTPDELDYLVTKDGDKHAEELFWNQFAEADTFGSLIYPDSGLTAQLKRRLETLDDHDDLLRSNTHNQAQEVIRQAQYLSKRFTVTIANPPYMGSRNMSPVLRELANAAFPASKADLYSMFMEKALRQTEPAAYVAMVTMQNWMFLASHSTLRSNILNSASIVAMAHLGSRAFGTISGEVVATTAFVLRNAPSTNPGEYLRLTDLSAGEKQRSLIQAARGDLADRGYMAKSSDFALIPEAPIAYDFSEVVRRLYRTNRSLGERVSLKQGMATTDNARFVRLWHEVSNSAICRGAQSTSAVQDSRGSWVPYNKGGTPTNWYGNQDFIILWRDGAADLATVRPKSVLENRFFFQPSVSWSNIGTAGAKFRYYPAGFVFDVAGMSAFPINRSQRLHLLGYLNSSIAGRLLQTLAPTLNYQIGDIGRLPYVGEGPDSVEGIVQQLIELRTSTWRLKESTWGFSGNPIIGMGLPRVHEAVEAHRSAATAVEQTISRLEVENDAAWAELLAVGQATTTRAPRELPEAPSSTDVIEDLISYAVGCMFGRYSLDEPGLILADQGATVQDYLARVSTPTFAPDADNVLPIVEGEWFEDDIVARFRQFLQTTFGDEYFEENLRFVEESLGVKSLREYFITRAGRSRFYDDHVKRYKKRPIYWLFSSPKGSFNALVYMHRYTPSTVSTVLNEYLREFESKLKANLQHQKRVTAGDSTPRVKAAALKETERLRKILLELSEYEHDVLYPLASQQITINLDDGVLVNYLRFGKALAKIPEIEKKRAEVETWAWPTYPLTPQDGIR